ncbi:MAG: hypothetical protein FWD79_04595 [Desulfobulbus sp.]|nr:hypothetical protein [Desulfobulbus sp.]
MLKSGKQNPFFTNSFPNLATKLHPFAFKKALAASARPGTIYFRYSPATLWVFFTAKTSKAAWRPALAESAADTAEKASPEKSQAHGGWKIEKSRGWRSATFAPGSRAC